MTLYRKLLISISLTFSLLFVGLFYVDYHQSRQFIAQKQFSEVKNAIHTVGLALSPYLEDNDPVAVETAVNALFDGSSFSSVRVVMLQTGDEIVRSYPIRGDNAPKWLVNMDIFQTIHEKRTVTSGWLQLAEIEIISHPGVAYAALWRNMEVTFGVGIASFIFSLVLISYFVRRSLEPLKHLSSAATQIARRDFDISLNKPDTQDLVPVFNAFELMVVRIKAFVEEQTRQADNLRTQAFIDKTSTLANRNYFISQLESKKAEGETLAIVIIQYEEARLAKLNHDFESINQLMQQVGPALKTLTNDSSIVCARLLDDEIGVIASYKGDQQVEDLLLKITELSNSAVTSEFAIGTVITDSFPNSKAILSSIDTALTRAKLETNRQYISRENKELSFTSSQWVLLVEHAMSRHAVKIKSQLVKGISNDAYHREIFSGIEHEGNHIPAIMYLVPMEKYNKAHLYDQFIIESMIKEIKNESTPVPVAINLAPSTVTSAEFITWLEAQLQKTPQISHYLHFELHEAMFIYHKEMTQLLVSVIHRNGAKFGVDNFGHHLKSLDYLQKFSPDYVKLDYLFTHNLNDEQTIETLSSVAKLAHEIGAFVIATRIENQKQIRTLAMHNVNGLQGFAIDAKDDNE